MLRRRDWIGLSVPRDGFLPQGLGDSGNCQTLWSLVPLKCDRWAEFSRQFKHFALICVLVCILFWDTNFKTSFVCRPSKLTGALSSFWVGCSSDSSRLLPKDPAACDLHSSQLGVIQPQVCWDSVGDAGRWGPILSTILCSMESSSHCKILETLLI